MSKNPTYSPYLTRVTAVDGNTITVQRSYNDVLNTIRAVPITSGSGIAKNANAAFTDWSIIYKHKDKRDLSTFLHFGDDKMLLTVNATRDDALFEEYPYSTVYKLYESLPDDIEEKDNVYVVREVLPQFTETVEN